jgi:predicted outer membrane repeat protein
MALVLPVLALPAAAGAVTRQVPSQYATLALALDTAKGGDVILLAPGIHQAAGLRVAADITLAGGGAVAEDTILDAGGSDRILFIESGPDTILIRNLTFRNGLASGETNQDRSGGAVLVNRSVARFEACFFTGNVAEVNGGAIRSVDSALIVEGCTFKDNKAPGGGGGACEAGFGSRVAIRESLFLNNSSSWGGALSFREGAWGVVDKSRLVANDARGDHGFGGAVFADQGAIVGITGSVLSGNWGRFGGAVACFAESQVNLGQVTICDNTAHVTGGGMLVINASPFITGSIIAFNEGRGITLAGNSALAINCTDIHGNSLGDWTTQLAAVSNLDFNSSVDPQFCNRDPLSADGLHLSRGAQLIDLANGCGIPGAFQQTCGTTSTTTANEAPPPAPIALAPTASPNPFNPRTVIRFALGVSQPVRVEVHGLKGELVRVLADETLAAGEHAIPWEGRDARGRPLASGMYLVVVRGIREARTLKVTLLK